MWLISLAHWFGSAVCDQLVAHSYTFDGIVLPLCARCTGMYLGALVTLGFHVWRHPREVGLPRPRMLLALLLFFLAWAGDGVNSFLSVIPMAPHLYLPANILRLVTGTLMGITVGSLTFVMFNSSVWSVPDPMPIFTTSSEFFALLGLGALIIVVVQSEWAPLLYPLTLASLAAILILHTGLMAAMVASAWRRRTTAWQGAIPALGLGLTVALAYLDLFALVRFVLSSTLGLPG